jgi:hypothetical protein
LLRMPTMRICDFQWESVPSKKVTLVHR